MIHCSATNCAAGVRALPVALAHEMAKCKAGRDYARLEILNRIFNTLDNACKLATRAELRECRAAIRGERLAVVS